MVDLHFHSTFSDGLLAPAQLVELGAQAGLSAMVLTDHDTADGQQAFAAAAAAAGISTLTGIELNTDHEGHNLHLLGYGYDPADPGLAALLAKSRAIRVRRNAAMLSKLSLLGCPISQGELDAAVGRVAVPGRPHIARALIAKGYSKNVRHAFDKLLGQGKPAYVKHEKLDAIEAIAVLRASGGIPVLAHPCECRQKGMSAARLREIVTRLAAAGLGGIEVWHSANAPEHANEFLNLSEAFALAATGGSDFHGDMDAHLRLGTGYGRLSVPDTAFEQLRRLLA
jgi:Predicted metal-dependent phosphoesterases (PHP family)